MELAFDLINWLLLAVLLWGAIKIAEPHNPANKFWRAVLIGAFASLLFGVLYKVKVSEWLVEVLVVSAVCYLLVKYYKMNIRKSIVIVIIVFFIHTILSHILGPLISPS